MEFPHRALTYRQTAAKIADDYLAERNIKPHRRRTKLSNITDELAYDDGKKYSKEIDLNRNRLG